MIFYFSGTGNSLQVAKEISKVQHVSLYSITQEMSKNQTSYSYQLTPEEKVIFVFPIYAWAPPKMVLDFIDKLTFEGNNHPYLCCIGTCGENMGNTMTLLQDKFKIKGLTLSSGFSLKMPNNYMMFGDVEKKENVEPILTEADERIKYINEVITAQLEDVFEIVLGPMPSFLTKIVNPFFSKYAINIKQFEVNEDCIGCKICERICNGHCITVNEIPTWKAGCTSCLACINYCPKSAINYGKQTVKKGRYVNPRIKVNEMYLK